MPGEDLDRRLRKRLERMHKSAGIAGATIINKRDHRYDGGKHTRKMKKISNLKRKLPDCDDL